ncbi:polyprenyl synthetase family protein [Desulfocurvus sp.]|jgi:geranylgeranyl diphosphate synthase type II|uniref:polyprenyl synthetase family protein n=1 Tax=Desulfocurvus sp. TaxID=2871698 RepID=UPI0025C58762|nr:farnesyl diphosphate synthase [Desulfocurvus sp.]MCK9239413.1 polyprenyl synthetase family protein [Desulfocurvus sp.]
MPDVDVKKTLANYAAAVERHLETFLEGRDVAPRLAEAMRYSLLAGGKRLRPVLCLVWAEIAGTPSGPVVPFAAAIECIHTYSLIHDDLPAMDNDDLRRGKPTSHKVFGEATAILAGDALLTEAFSLMLGVTEVPAERVLQAAAVVAYGAGPSGMVGGQQIDMELTGRAGVELRDLQRMHSLKTGALITASCLAGCILGGGGETDMQNALDYGKHLGMAFQIADDILDVVGDQRELGKPVGSDQGQGKNTYPSLVGLEESRVMAIQCAVQANRALQGYQGPQVDFLGHLAAYVVERTN